MTQDVMTQDVWTDVDHYFTDMLVAPDAVLKLALADSEKAGLPSISASPTQGKLLELLARSLGAGSILEIGTLGGYSTICLARGLRPGGRLVTLEKEQEHANVARANIARAGLSEVVELRVGSALDTLPQLAAEGRGPFDFIFIDADKPNIPAYFGWALKLSRTGSLIVVDNVVRDGAVIDADSTDPSIQGVRRFVELLAATPNVSGTAIQTVGTKGYDGFAIVLVEGPAAIVQS